MPETITLTVSATVKSGPELRASWQAVLPAYEKMEIEIEGGKTATLPLGSADGILLLVLSVGSSDGPVSYKFGGQGSGQASGQGSGQQGSGQTGGGQQGVAQGGAQTGASGSGGADSSVTLAQLPRVLIYQKGMVPSGNPTLEFTNSGQKPVVVDVLVGRDFVSLAAAPPSQPAQTTQVQAPVQAAGTH